MDSIFNFAIEMDEDEFTTSKKDVLKFLKIIFLSSQHTEFLFQSDDSATRKGTISASN